jgi:hypothetical protein
MIDTLNDFMLIEEYEIMLVINRINEKNRKMFFDNIVYVLFIDVILMFVTRLKKQNFVWNMYKKALMNKSIDAMICDIEKKHDLLFLKYRSIEKFVNAVVRMMILKQSKRRRTLFRRRKFDILIRSI